MDSDEREVEWEEEMMGIRGVMVILVVVVKAVVLTVVVVVAEDLG